jgi:hypothetical protein
MRIVSGFVAVVCVLFCSCSKKQTSNPSDRLAWHTKTLMKGYDTVGRHDAKWDASVHDLLSRYVAIRVQATGTVDTNALAAIGLSVQEAVNAGCDDPLIRYLYCRFAPEHAAKPFVERREEFRSAAQALESSGYSPYLKFYANDRAAVVMWQQYDPTVWQEVVQLRRAAMSDIMYALGDKSMPVEEVWDAVELLIQTVSDNSKELPDAWNQIQGPLFQNWPDAAVSYMIQGQFYYQFAWKARGNATADKVTEAGWKTFREDLAVAETAYRKAWDLNPHDARIANRMIEMAVSQQKDRKEMELWFQRAMDLDTNDFTACKTKLRYLDPKWNGTPEDMIAFGKECVASKKWGGDVPLTLTEARRAIAMDLPRDVQAEYWRMPEVWSDIQASYERYFELHPNAGSKIRYPYAWYAFRCGKMEDFTYQVKLIRDADGTVVSNYFGGDEVFNKLVEKANADALSN